MVEKKVSDMDVDMGEPRRIGLLTLSQEQILRKNLNVENQGLSIKSGLGQAIWNKLVPESRIRYSGELRRYRKWRMHKTDCEDTLLGFWTWICKFYSVSTAVSRVSMVKTCYQVFADIDVDRYKELKVIINDAIRKAPSPKQSAVLEDEVVRRYLGFVFLYF